MVSVRVVGPGRAGTSLAAALLDKGLDVRALVGRGDCVAHAAEGVDFLFLAVPDASIAPVARQVVPVPSTVVVHMSGSLGLDELYPHERMASMHPLVPLPDAEVGRERLSGGAFFAVDGDQRIGDLVAVLGGKGFNVDPSSRSAYHAAACVAANHLVALMGQVERIAEMAGLPLAPFLDLARAAIDDTALLGPAGAWRSCRIRRLFQTRR